MFLEEEQYIHAMALFDGKIRPEPLFAEFRVWFSQKYQITLYDYICDFTNNGLTRLKALLWNEDDEKKLRDNDSLNYDKAKQREIAVKFAELSKKYNVHPEYQNPDNVFVCADTLKDEIAKRIMRSAKRDIENIRHPDIRRIEIAFETVFIFYETDEQAERHQADGTDDMISKTIAEIIRPLDKYNVYNGEASCEFSSIQTLDEQYEGSMYFYLL